MRKTRIKLSSNESAKLSLLINSIQRSLSDESNRAQTAEQILDSKISSTATTAQTNSTAINNEIKRAKKQESILENSVAQKLSAQTVTWNEGSNIDDYITQGYYIINGERLNNSDGLPINNSNPGHTVAATLIVADSTINSSERCITQFLILSNRLGSDGNAYIRTATGNQEKLSWGSWGRMVTNIEVGQVDSLNNYKDNGVYSGIYFYGSNIETFIMLVINNYVAAGTINATQSISQFKYALAIDGTVTFKKRIGGGGFFGPWEDINATPSGYDYNRPENPTHGSCFFDDSLGKPIWWNGTLWVDATGSAI